MANRRHHCLHLIATGSGDDGDAWTFIDIVRGPEDLDIGSELLTFRIAWDERRRAGPRRQRTTEGGVMVVEPDDSQYADFDKAFVDHLVEKFGCTRVNYKVHNPDCR